MAPVVRPKAGAGAYRTALLDVYKKLKDHDPLAVARFSDGEIAVLQKQWFDLGEYSNDPQDPSCSTPIARLGAAFRYKHHSYFVGIPCPHCEPRDFAWAVKESGQDVVQLTFGLLFTNSNYSFFLNNIVPLFSEYEVILVCNKAADLTGLPFKVSKDFRIGWNAWRNESSVIEELKTYADKRSSAGLLFLFAAGPLSCMAIHELHRHHPLNTYLDIGSTLDSYFFGKRGASRGYLWGSDDLLDSCNWTPGDFAALSNKEGGVVVDVPQQDIESLDNSALEMWSEVMHLLKSGCQKSNEDSDRVGRPSIYYSEDRVEKPEFALSCLGSRLIKLYLEGDHIRSGESAIPSNQGIVIRHAFEQGDRFHVERNGQTTIVTMAELGNYLLSPIFDYLETVTDSVKGRWSNQGPTP